MKRDCGWGRSTHQLHADHPVPKGHVRRVTGTGVRHGHWLRFELFPVLKDMLKRKGGVLSGGQQQQLAIGRALLTNPKLLIFDEPTEGIQPSIIDQIEDAIQVIKERHKVCIILVEQYLDFAKAASDIFYILERGSIVKKGPTEDLDEDLIARHLTV